MFNIICHEEIAMRYHYTLYSMAKIQNTDNTKCWWGCGATRNLIYCWWECKTAQPLWKTVWQFLTKISILLPYNLATTVLSIYPKELKTYAHTKTCSPVSIATLFIIAKTRKQPRCTSVGEWINKLWYQTVGYCSVLNSGLKRNELSSPEETRGILNAY